MSSIILAGFVIGFAIYINNYWRPFLTSQIHEAIITSTDSLYSISFKEINVNVITGSATIKKITFDPDTNIYNKLIKTGKAPKHLFSVEVALVKLNRIHPFKVYFDRKLQINSVIVIRPKIRMIYKKVLGKQDTIADDRNAYQRLSKFLTSIKVNKIFLQEVDFQYVDKSAKRNQLTSLQNLHVEIAGLLIDSASQSDRSKFYYTDNISVKLLDYEYRTLNGMYDMKIKEFNASARDKTAKVIGLRLIPRYSEMEFAKKLNQRKERFALRFNEVLLKGVDFKNFIEDRRLIATKLIISNSNSNIFLSKEMPRMPKDATLSFPQKAFDELNLETSIDSVIIKNARISYSEYSSESRRKGQIFFDHVEGSITNLTNDSIAKTRNNISKTALTGLLMGRGRINANINFNLTDPVLSYSVNASVGNMNASLFNRVLRPLALIEIRNGSLEEMKVSLKGNLQGTKGSLRLKYTDLKVNLLSKEEDDPRLRKMGIATMAANVLILENSNPLPGERLRISKIDYKRPDSASFVNMNWKAILGGLKASVGLDKNTQQKIQAKLQELKAEKADRAERREERLKRRDERRDRNK